MLNYLKSEQLKQRRTFHTKLLVAGPAVSIFICMFLMARMFLQTASYNWWYITFLPFTFTYICSAMVSREKKHNFHNLFAAVEDKKKLWYAKILMSVIYLAVTSAVFCVLIEGVGLIFGRAISPVYNLLAGLVLMLTFAWQLPLWMLVTLKSNLFLSVFLSIVCNLGFGAFFALSRLWWVPFAIPARMMCPVLNILPNGILMDKSHALNNAGVILPGILITLVMFVILSMVSAKVYEKQEV